MTFDHSKYKETLDYMFSQLPMYQRMGKPAFKKDLTNILKLVAQLGNPHRNLKCIHIAGTNGKGTVAHLLSAFLQEMGYKVGIYTSPHYKDFRERIKINGEYISEEEVISFIDNNKQMFAEIKPSFFEMTVAMAFDYFANKKVDFVVLETGLGGRLDSTNIVTPLLSVITNISMDHESMLGDTLPDIAREKAGIIKHGIPVIIGEHGEETDIVFVNKAQKKMADIYFAQDMVQLSLEPKKQLNKVDIVSDNYTLNMHCETQLEGAFQKHNIVTASAAFLKFNEWYLEKSRASVETAIKQGLLNLKETTTFIGRWEILGDKPTIIADSAHNEAGIRLAIEKLKEYNVENIYFVLAFVKDKDHKNILRLFPQKAKYFFSKAKIPRACPIETLEAVGHDIGLNYESFYTVGEAMNAAKKQASDNDLIFVGGSIFTVAEVI